MRLLILIPILHGIEDMGSFGEAVKREYVLRHGLSKWKEHSAAIDGLWSRIGELIEALALPHAQVRIYQDGLPDRGPAEEIVKKLAGQGSTNHQLLLRLIENGAKLMGTESPELLKREYELLRNAHQAPASPPGGTAATTGDESRGLLVERDRYIAQKINHTLRAGEIGLLFLGLNHSVESLLEEDILIKNVLPSLSARGTEQSASAERTAKLPPN